MANKVEVIVTVKDNASSPLKGITGSLSSMASVAGGIIGADLLGRMGEGLLAVGIAGFDGARGIENATARLNAFTKDATVSTEILNQLRMEAAKTPFAFQDMADAGASLLPISQQLNVDLMDLVQTAEILAASNPAEGLAGAAFALKEAASGDFTSIIERFNLSRSAIQALKDEGVPNLEIVARAMADARLDMDLVSNMSETFDGRMSTLIDTFREVAIAFATPIFGVISEGLAGAQVSLSEAMPFLLETASKWGQLAADSITTFKEAWSGEWEDDEIIQPVHRFVGKTTLAIQGMWEKTVAIGEEYGPKLAEAWGEIEWAAEDLSQAWGPLNMVAGASVKLFAEVGRLGGEMAEDFGFVAEKADGANDALADTLSMGDALKSFWYWMAIGIERTADAIAAAADAWARFNDVAAGGVPTVPSAPAYGPDAVPGVEEAPPNNPNVNSGGSFPANNSQGQTTSGGSGGRGQTSGMTTTTQQRGGDTFIYNIYTPIDWEQAAYEVSKRQQERRSTT